MKIPVIASLLFAIAAVLHAQTAEQLKEATGIRSGLAVHLGCGDGTLARDLAKEGRFLVQGLTVDPAVVRKARNANEKEGLAGLVTVIDFSNFHRLPYNDNMVDLIVADFDALGATAPESPEVIRVLSPFGAAYVKKDGKWTLFKKDLPEEMDEWTHHNYLPDGSTQGKDKLIGTPRGIQWFVSSGGTMTSELRLGGGNWVQSGRLSEADKNDPTWFEGRNAFNGLLKWREKEMSETRGTRSLQDSTFCTDGDTVYGILDDPKIAKAWDLRTGKELVVYSEGLKNADSAKDFQFRNKPLSLHHLILGKVLLQAGGEGDRDVAALDAATGKLQWDWTAPGDLNVALVAVNDGRVYLGLTGLAGFERYHYGNKLAELDSLVALDLATGKPLWKNDEVKGYHSFNLVAAENAVFLANNDFAHGKDKPSVGAYSHLVRIDGPSGKTAFNVDIPKLGVPSETSWNYKLRYKDGLLLPAYGGAVVTFDAKNGELVGKPYEMPGKTYQDPPLFCSTIRGTSDGFLTGKFSRFVDVKDGYYSALTVGRSGCDRGSYPAYGLIYSGDDSCGCTSWLRGWISLHSRDYSELAVPTDDRLVKGPAYGPVTVAPAAANDWPVMLGAPDRLGHATSKLGANLKELKKVQIPVDIPDGPITVDWKNQNDICGSITPPVVVGSTAYLAATHQQRLYAVDFTTGSVKWSFPAGGRIDSPPTIYQGLCLFGCRDGWVYALRASDGALVWKFLVAPDHRQIVNSGQLENASPVFGSVMILRDKLFVHAGRHNQADGGIPLWRLDPRTGVIEKSAIIGDTGSSSREANDFATSDGQGRISDILTTTADGKYLVLNVFAINPESLSWTGIGQHEDGGPVADIDLADPSIMAFSYNNAIGTMDRRSDSIGSKGGGGFLYGTRSRKDICTGKRIVRVGETNFAVNGRDELIRYPLDEHGMPKPVGPKKKGEPIGKVGAKGNLWAMAVTDDSLVIAAGNSVAIHGHDGKERQKLQLPADAVAYGIAIASDKLFVSSNDGTLSIYGN